MTFELKDLLNTLPPTERVAITDMADECIADNDRRCIESDPAFMKKYGRCDVLSVYVANGKLNVIVDKSDIDWKNRRLT